MASVGTYKIIAIGPGHTIERTRQGAPNDSWIVGWAMLKKKQFVTRYYPSRKGWLVIDCRRAIEVTAAGRYKHIVGHNRINDRVFPHENAAVMFAMSLLGYQVPTG